MNQLLPKLYPFSLLILGLLFFVPFLGYSPLFDGAELRFAEAAREMLVTNTFSYAQLDFLPNSVTPPLLPWLQTLSMRIFGVVDNAELAARLPSALMGVVTMLALFFIGQKKHDARFGFLWALSYLGSVTPFILAKSALPATTGYWFTFLGILFFIEAVSGKQPAQEGRNLLWSGLFLGSGLLTTTGLVSGFTVIVLILIKYWRVERRPLPVKVRVSVQVLSIPILCSIVRLALIPGADWQRALFPPSTGSEPVDVLFLLAGCVAGLLTVITLASRYWSIRKTTTAISTGATFLGWMTTVAQASIILVIYSPSGILLTWFPLSYLATYHLYQLLRGERTWDKVNTYLLLIDGFLVGLVMTAIPLIGMNPDWLARRTTSSFWAGITEAPVNWQGWEWLIGAVLIITTAVFALRMRRRVFQSVIGLYVSTAICTLAFLTIIVPKIEQYLQGPLIDFCEAKWNQPVYVQTSFSSYATLFYTRKKPPVKAESRQIHWLTNGPVDKQTFIITTATDADQYQYNPNLELLNEEYGYVFFKRKQYR